MRDGARGGLQGLVEVDRAKRERGDRKVASLAGTKKSLAGALDDPLHFAETGSLAAEAAEIEELGAAHLVGANLLDLVDNLGVVREDALDALAEAHLANGKGALGP